jgi:hypothetical protein
VNRFGVSAMVDEVVHVLGLSESVVAWKANEDVRQSITQVLEAWLGSVSRFRDSPGHW